MLTMTIVGVVAALTIPTLHYQRLKKEYSAKLKNFYSKVHNAILDMEMDKGSFRDVQKPTGSLNNGLEWWLEYIDPYMGHSMVDEAHNKVYFKDGSNIGVYYVGHFLEFYYDVNGDKSPNRYGYDRYLYLFGFDDNTRERCFSNPDTFFGVYCPAGVSITGVTRDELVNRCKNGHEGYGAGVWCTKLLQNDQWEYKSDYPYKF